MFDKRISYDIFDPAFINLIYMTHEEEGHALKEILTMVRYIKDNMMTKKEGLTKEDLKVLMMKQDV